MNLITGATGFIGRHLARRLVRERQRVRVLCRPGSERRLPSEIAGAAEIFIGDLRDRKSLLPACAGAARIFHCAGHVSDWGPEETFFAMNVQGTRWLLDAARAASVQRVVHLSSIAAFGTPAPEYFDDHSGYGKSKDAYSRTKAEGEKIAFEFHQAGLPVTVLRPAVVYGPEGAWLEEPLRMIEKDRMFLLGGGTGTCHPCYIENLVDAMLLAADHPRAAGQGYIVGDGESISFREYFDALASIAGKGPVRRSVPLPAARALAIACEAGARLRSSTTRPLLTQTAIGMVTTRSRMSIGKIRAELGWTPRYTFASAIDELRRWYSDKRRLLA